MRLFSPISISLLQDVDIFQLQQLCAFGGLLTPMILGKDETLINLQSSLLETSQDARAHPEPGFPISFLAG